MPAWQRLLTQWLPRPTSTSVWDSVTASANLCFCLYSILIWRQEFVSRLDVHQNRVEFVKGRATCSNETSLPIHDKILQNPLDSDLATGACLEEARYPYTCNQICSM